MEVPSITVSAYASSTLDQVQPMFGGGHTFDRRLGGQAIFDQSAINVFAQAKQQEKPNMTTARIVKVFIADANENLPLEKRVLYSGDEKLTDLTDQELFFDVPIADLLAKHNETRKATVDKAQAEKFGRDIFLEAARIRDLKMVVVTVAQF